MAYGVKKNHGSYQYQEYEYRSSHYAFIKLYGIALVGQGVFIVLDVLFLKIPDLFQESNDLLVGHWLQDVTSNSLDCSIPASSTRIERKLNSSPSTNISTSEASPS